MSGSVTVSQRRGEQVTELTTEIPEVLDASYYLGGSGLRVELGLDLSRTINLGDFESVRVGVSVRVPVLAELVGEAWPQVTRWVKERLVEECKGPLRARGVQGSGGCPF